MEFKGIQFENKVDMDDRTFEGYAAAFGNIDSYNDIIHKGAFQKTIREKGKAGKIKVFYNHTWPIGLPVKMKEDDHGLYVTGKVSKTLRGDEILELMRDSVINEMSIGYEAIKFDRENRGKMEIRNLREIALYEFGPVDFAANDQAVITAVKEMAGKKNLSPDVIRETIRALDLMLKALEPVNTTPTDDEPGMFHSLEVMTKEVNDFKQFIQSIGR